MLRWTEAGSRVAISAFLAWLGVHGLTSGDLWGWLLLGGAGIALVPDRRLNRLLFGARDASYRRGIVGLWLLLGMALVFIAAVNFVEGRDAVLVPPP